MREFQISAHSMSVLRQYSEDLYCERLAALVSGLTDGHEPAHGIQAECRVLTAQARVAGFQTEFEIAAYVACAFAEGHDFGEPYRTVVNSPGMSARSKAEMLMLLLEHSGTGEEEESGNGEEEG